MKNIFQKIRSIKPKFIILALLLLAVIVFLVPHIALASNVGDKIIIGVGWLLYGIVYALGSLLTVVIGWLVQVASWNNFTTIDVVQNGWVIVRDICNMFFIVGLLIIAFATILRMENYAAKNMLFKFVIMAVMINFSKMICGILIDAGQIIMLSFVNGFANGGANNLTYLLGMHDMMQWAQREQYSAEGLNLVVLAGIITGFFASMIAFVTVVAMLVTLLIRAVMLWIYVILSPLAYLLGAFPGGQKLAQTWWSDFMKNVAVGPLLAFFLWLALSTSSSVSQKLGTKYVADQNLGQNIGSGLLNAETFQIYIITIGLLVGGLAMTQKIGGVAGKAAGVAMKNIQKGSIMAAKVPLGAAGGLAKGVGGQVYKRAVRNPVRFGVDSLYKKTGVDLNLKRANEKWKGAAAEKRAERVAAGEVRAGEVMRSGSMVGGVLAMTGAPADAYRQMTGGKRGILSADWIRNRAMGGKKFTKKNFETGQQANLDSFKDDFVNGTKTAREKLIDSTIEEQKANDTTLTSMREEYQSNETRLKDDKLSPDEEKVLKKKQEYLEDSISQKEVTQDILNEKINFAVGEGMEVVYASSDSEDRERIFKETLDQIDPEVNKNQAIIDGAKVRIDEIDIELKDSSLTPKREGALKAEKTKLTNEMSQAETKVNDLLDPIKNESLITNGQNTIQTLQKELADNNLNPVERTKKEKELKETKVSVEKAMLRNSAKESLDRVNQQTATVQVSDNYRNRRAEISTKEKDISTKKEEISKLQKEVEDTNISEVDKKKKMGQLKTKREEVQTLQSEVESLQHEQKTEWSKAAAPTIAAYNDKKKKFKETSQESKKEYRKYTPSYAFEARATDSELVRNEMKKIADISDPSELLNILKDAIKSNEKARVKAVIKKMTRDYNDNEFLSPLVNDSGHKGLQRLMTQLSTKGSENYAGFSRQEAFALGAEVAEMNKNTNHWGASAAFMMNPDGTWRTTTEKEHVLIRATETGKIEPQTMARNGNRLAYGWEDGGGNFHIDTGGIMTLKQFDDPAGLKNVGRMTVSAAVKIHNELVDKRGDLREEFRGLISKRLFAAVAARAGEKPYGDTDPEKLNDYGGYESLVISKSEDLDKFYAAARKAVDKHEKLRNPI